MKNSEKNTQTDDLNLIKFRYQINYPLLIDFIAGLFFILFVYAAANKLMDYEKFQVQLGQSPILAPFAHYVVWTIPILEILISSLLFLPKTRLLALYASFSLMAMFTFYIIAILKFSDDVPCSCGGILEKMDWSDHLTFNIIFVLLALTGIILQAKIHTVKSTANAV